MNDIPKSIELFLQKNGLSNTLKVFQGQIKRTSHLATKNVHSSLSGIKNTKIANDEESQNLLREHLQKADPKYLKKFVERVKKSNQRQHNISSYSKLAELPFFKKLVEKERENYEEYKQNILQSFNTPPRFLDESRFNENQWQGQNDLGYDLFEFQTNEFPKVVKEIQSMKHYELNAIKEVAYPEAYFAIWEQLRNSSSYNHHDKMKSKLPANCLFASSNNKLDLYPLEQNGAILDCYDLRIIYDRQKTGFQQERELKIVINQVLAGRFQVLSLLGQAQFSKAIQVKDLTSASQKQRYCLKVILNNKDYFDQALDEIKLLRYIKANVNPDEVSILNMHEYFYHRQHLMILTQLLKQNLYDVYRQNPNYFTLPVLQSITKQILTALSAMHRLHIIHNDLKPQNILIKSSSKALIKVIDIGSSVFFHDDLQFYVQTRSYRAPQIILGCPYSQKIDIWSLGCIIAQLFTRQVLFQSDNVVGILAKVQGLRGPWPSWMIQTGTEVKKHFTKELILFQQIIEEIGEEGNKKKRKTGFTRIYLPKLTNLQSRIQSSNKNFLDFLSKCLKIDPSTRISAKQALNHPFITEPIVQH